jgi:hypothetical protein
MPVEPVKAETETITDPATMIKSRSANFHDLYVRYATLRELASRLNGLAHAALLPDNITVPKVTIEFTVDNKPYSATIDKIQIIGEISGLLSGALRRAIESMYDDLFAVEHVAAEMQKVIAAAVNQNSANQETQTNSPPTTTNEETT